MHIKKNFQSTGHIRIIGGQWRGYNLSVLNNPGLRPTTDRMRETLFNWLDPVIQNARCLDCFAGSGSLGLEALSRGASNATLLEINRAASIQLTKNIQFLTVVMSAKVITTDTLYWLMQPGETFDVIFIDPPFYQGIVENVITLLEQYKRLADKSWIYIETEVEKIIPNLASCWQLHREKLTRNVAYRLYVRRLY
ncbi:16S rRNA (guanine(966)-N(2))-methyltransferase RsmD [Candidatus Curculioniphilus buchneri]|uniref:16S rRNA (guanine(966)-N(2))-methyltransferase RsmD n=1 Tax=Candidatus Curculioniphilus buchneri TaxID=690594 RepID=UPI00376F322E